MDFGPIFERSESTNSCPIQPTPSGSPVPRAKTTSTSGQGPEATEGTAKAEGTGAIASVQAAPTAAQAKRTRLRGLTLKIVSRSPIFSNMKGTTDSETPGPTAGSTG